MASVSDFGSDFRFNRWGGGFQTHEFERKTVFYSRRHKEFTASASELNFCRFYRHFSYDETIYCSNLWNRSLPFFRKNHITRRHVKIIPRTVSFSQDLVGVLNNYPQNFEQRNLSLDRWKKERGVNHQVSRVFREIWRRFPYWDFQTGEIIGLFLFCRNCRF